MVNLQHICLFNCIALLVLALVIVSCVDMPSDKTNLQSAKFSEEKTGYEDINGLKDIEGKLVYIAKKITKVSVDLPPGVDKEKYGQKDLENTVIVYNGQEFGEEYGEVSDPVVINGKLAFLASASGQPLIVFDGKETGREDYIVSPPVAVNNKLVYIVEKGEYIKDKGHKKFVMYDGKQVSEGYFEVRCLKEVGGKLLYIVTEEGINGSKDYVVWGDLKVGGYSEIECDSVIDVGGKLTYVGFERGEGTYWNYLVHGDQVIKYDTVISPKNVNGKLAYFARNGRNEFIVYDGKIVSEGYSDVGNPMVINGKLTYTADKVLFYGTEKVGRGYDYVDFPKEINGKLTYMAGVIAGDKIKRFIVYGEEELGKEYDEVGKAVGVNGKIAYAGVKGKKIFVIYNKEIVGEYDYVGDLIEVNDKLVFSAKKGDSWYIVHET
jgi:hypothetical protein